MSRANEQCVAVNRMNSSLLTDIVRVIASYLDNTTLKTLYFAGAIPSLIPASLEQEHSRLSLAQDQQFWHTRVETLSGLRVAFSSVVDWRQTYRVLDFELNENFHPSFYNKEDNITVLQILSSLNFKPDKNALYLAAHDGASKIVSYLLKLGSINPNESADDNYPPLTIAAQQGYEEVVRLLLAHPNIIADISDGGSTPLVEAIEAGHTSIVKLLLARPDVDPSWQDSVALQLASYSGDNSEIVELLLADKRVDPSADDNEALITAACDGRKNIVKLLLSDVRVDPSVRENQAIKRASHSGYVEVIKILLADPRVDPTYNDNILLYQLMSTAHLQLLKLILDDHRVDPSYANGRLLSMAIGDGRPELISIVEEAIEKRMQGQ